MAKLRDQGVKFDVLDAKIYTFQLFSAIGHLAMNNIVHMDIKPQNVIMDRVYTSKMLDPEIYDMMKSMLKIDPKKRKSAVDVLKMPVFNALKAVPRKKRSNGMEIPNLLDYSEMHHKRESDADAIADVQTTEKAEKESRSSSSHSDEEDKGKGK
uniref:Protein kinase domain-containing protein n=1 Tax=Caenorhabditis tropicalis TaxID=1561998 RepID=A0A1I7TS96_9PELO